VVRRKETKRLEQRQRVPIPQLLKPSCDLLPGLHTFLVAGEG
jgi:hypothetical protein